MEHEKKNRYGLGMLGALLGAFVGSIPWILMYVFGNMMYSILAILIVLCSFYGYKIMKAKIDKKLPLILSICSFIAITVTMFILIPISLMMKEEISISVDNLKLIYETEEFMTALISDYVISLVFCLVVIGGIIYNLNKQLKEGVNSEDIKIISQDASNSNFSNEDIDKVKSIFENYGATNKENTVNKEEIMDELIKEFGEDKGKRIFDYLKVQEIIKKKSNKFYFSEKAQKSAWYRYGMTSLKTFIIVIVLAVIIALVIVFSEQAEKNKIENNISSENILENTYDLGVDNLKLEFPSDFTILNNSQIEYYLGEEYKDAYNCLAVSDDFQQIVMVFEDDKSNYEEDYTPEEYLQYVLKDESIKIEEETISDNKFYIVERPYEDEKENEYVEIDCIYDAGDKFICIIFDCLQEDKINIRDIIK